MRNVGGVFAALKIVARRVPADKLMFSAAAITVLLAITVISASPMYADAVTLASLHRVLEDGESAANIEVRTRTRPETFPELDNIVREEAARAFAVSGASIYANVRGTTFDVPFVSEDDLTNVAVVEHFEDLESRATLQAGTWPRAGTDPVELAVFEVTANALGISVGDEFTMTSRHTPSRSSEVRIVGVFSVDDFSHPYWHASAAVEVGVEIGGSFRYFGPFVGPVDTVLDHFAIPAADLRWRILPDHESLLVEDIPQMRAGVDNFIPSLRDREPRGVQFRMETRLPTILRVAERSVIATRSGVLMLSIQTAALAAFALVHTAGLLVESRSVETGLLRARGTANGQVATLALYEGLLVAVPAALLAPHLARLMLGGLNRYGPLADIGLRFDPILNRSAHVLAWFGALVCVATMAIPAYRSARTFNQSLVDTYRQPDTTNVQKIGIDIALLAIAGVAFWQIATNGVQLGAGLQERYGIDPLLVAAPALGILAGSILALRIVPLVASLAERVASSRRSTVAALSSWQIARRPRRYTRAALLLILAVGVGFFAAAYTATWTGSQADQASFQTGADIVLMPNRSIGAVSGLHRTDAYETVDGVDRAVPVFVTGGQMQRGDKTVRVFSMDAAAVEDVVLLREDLGGDRLPALMESLVEARPSLLELPGEPQWVFARVTVEPIQECSEFREELVEGFDPLMFVGAEDQVVCLQPSLRFTLQDSQGLIHRVDVGEMPAGATEAVVGGTLVTEAGLTPSYPLSLVGVEVLTTVPSIGHTSVSGVISVEILVSSREDGSDPEVVGLDDRHVRMQPIITIGTVVFRFNPEITPAGPSDPDTIRFRVVSGSSWFDGSMGPLPPVRFDLQIVPEDAPDAVPIVVTESFLEENGLSVGARINLEPLGMGVGRAEIVGALPMLPTVDPETQTGVILDLVTLVAISRPTSLVPDRAEYWLDIDESRWEQVAASLRRPDLIPLRVRNRMERARALSTDPMALSTIAALTLGFAVASVFAVIGFTLSTVMLARERRNEFTMLRALGLSVRQLRRWLFSEQGALVGISLFFGSLVGFLLATVILPLITVTQAGAIPIPEPRVVIPLLPIVGLQLAVVVVMVSVVLIISFRMRSRDLAAQLRLGGD